MQVSSIDFENIGKIQEAASRTRRILWILMATVVIFITWSSVATLNEVAIGEGKVTPASRGQIIQNLEGGILAELDVREGDIVEVNQKLASLDPVKAKANVEETNAKIVALKARASRLEAEINDREDVTFPQDIMHVTDVVDRERDVFFTNRKAFRENIDNLKELLALAEKEVTIVEPLLKTGAATDVELLRLRQKAGELSSRLAATGSEYYVALRADFAKTMADLEPLLKIQEGQSDLLSRTVIRSPARGIVKDIRVMTIGGIVAPGGTLMEIVPLGDQLLIEARLSPRDIAFIHPKQEANIKITAYDSAIYGSLPGTVVMVSPDSIQDDVDRKLNYYRVYILTENSYLTTKDGKQHPIVPGMVANAEIRTGAKTVLAYLMKPLNKAKEALRER